MACFSVDDAMAVNNIGAAGAGNLADALVKNKCLVNLNLKREFLAWIPSTSHVSSL